MADQNNGDSGRPNPIGPATPAPEPTTVYDFTGESLQESPIGVEVVTYNPGKHRERIRGVIAVGLLVAIVILVIFPYIALLTQNELLRGTPSVAPDKDWFTLLFTSIDTSVTGLIGVFGAVTGFYFGTLERNRNQE